MSLIATSTPDPMEWLFSNQHNVINTVAMIGKVPRYPRLVSGEKTGVFITAGQSLAAGALEGLYTPTNASKCDHISIHDGAMYPAVDPLLGHALSNTLPTQACVFTRVADKLVTGGQFQRVILIPVAYGGTTIATWDTSYHTFVIAAFRRAAALGITHIDGILWQLGETDNGLGTTQAAYTSAFLSMKAKVAAEFASPWFVAKSTYIPGGQISTGIRAACAALVNGVDVYAGPDTDVLTGLTNRYDDQHWNAVGNAAAATLWYNALDAVF